MNTTQTIWHSARSRGHTFIQNNRAILEPLTVATGVATIVVGSVALGQGLLLAKGATVAKGALAAGTGITATSLNQTATPLLAGIAGGAVGVGFGVRQKRQTDAQLRAQEAQLQAQRAQAEHLSAQMAAAEAQIESAQAETVQLHELRRVDQEQIEFLHTEIAAARAPALKPDRLEKIKGIGPVYAALLHEAGIITFAQLSQQTAEQLQAIVASAENSRMVNVTSWITQAQEFAREQRQSDLDSAGGS